MDASIIIPTFNRREVLGKCLQALDQQNCSSTYEVVLVDDASTDGTEEIVEELQKTLSFPLTFLRQEKKGPAAARNLGMKNCSGKLVIIMGDDIIATPHLVKAHLDWHSTNYHQNNAAILGFVTWSPDVERTPFMEWLEKKGWQFPYGEIEGKTEIKWTYLMTPNISFKREFLVANQLLFDERFPYAALEDYEFGFRFFQKGGTLYYNPAALGYHWHYTTLDSACQRMFYVGKAAKILQKIAPQLKPYKIAWRKYVCQFPPMRFFIKRVLMPLARYTEKRAVVHHLYACVLFCSFLDGLEEERIERMPGTTGGS
jgi:glycosyltransferase involved in cell wall biosynthesis